MPKVQNLFRAPKKHLPMEALAEVRVVDDYGFEGCAHAQPGGKRQVLLMDRETLERKTLVYFPLYPVTEGLSVIRTAILGYDIDRTLMLLA